MTTTSDVCVIGGGLSGVVAVKYCLEYNLSVIGYEQRSALGGIWTGAVPDVAQADGDGNPLVATYQSIVMNISQSLTTFTDFPLAHSLALGIDQEENFLKGSQFFEYLNCFARFFGVDRCFQLSTQVLEVAKSKVEDTDYRWAVTVRAKVGEKDMTYTSYHRYVIIASGFHHEVHIPEISGLSRTPVNVVHSGYLRRMSDLRAKRVLVCGDSITAGDTAEEAVVAGATKVTWAATRYPDRSVVMLKKIPFDDDVTWDMWFSLFSYRYYPNWMIHNAISKMISFAYRRSENADLDLANDRMTVQDMSVIDRAVHTGQLEIVPASVVNFSKEQLLVTLSNGTTTEADVCVLATGYKTTYPFLGTSALGNMQISDIVLHRHLIPVDPSLLGLIFLYTTGVFGGGFCGPEMEARWLAHQIANGRLSSKEEHQDLVSNAQLNTPIFNFGKKREAFSIVESLASELGCQPHFLLSAFFSPWPWRRRVGLAAMFGLWLPQLYRLRGPHAKPQEVESIIVSCAHNARGWKFSALVLAVDVTHTIVLGYALYSLLLWAKKLRA